MKQGINFMLPVEFGLDLDTVESIEFKFLQDGGVVQKFTYPSTTAVRDGTTNVVDLIWTPAETYAFSTKYPVKMDTFVKLTGSTYNPETEVVTLEFTPTLFTQTEVTT